MKAHEEEEKEETTDGKSGKNSRGPKGTLGKQGWFSIQSLTVWGKVRYQVCIMENGAGRFDKAYFGRGHSFVWNQSDLLGYPPSSTRR